MKKSKWSYISHRVFIISISFGILVFLLWATAFVLSLRQGQHIALICVLGVCLLVLSILAFWKVFLPYRRLEKNIYLYLNGYTVAGLKDNKVSLSVANDLLCQEIVRMLESDEMLNANKRQAQYLALQNQINPHFLYNTLESIRSEAMEAGMETVMNMTEALANFFRYTITNVDNLVTLEEELENVKTYFFIQQYRFEERISLSIECDEEEQSSLLRCLMPKLTLQPLVENSIIHGIERKLGKGTVRIVIRRTEKRLMIQVSDDGVGMSAEKLELVNRHLNNVGYSAKNQADNHGGIAISNVNNRIHLMFGEEYGMVIYSTPDVGTDMIITLPVITSRRQMDKSKELI